MRAHLHSAFLAFVLVFALALPVVTVGYSLNQAAQQRDQLANAQQTLREAQARTRELTLAIGHNLLVAEYDGCVQRNALRDRLVRIVSRAPHITPAGLAQFRADIGYQHCARP